MKHYIYAMISNVMSGNKLSVKESLFDTMMLGDKLSVNESLPWFRAIKFR